ncbi:MAG: NUDIX domain-containing protein, partial [Pseudomonadota bacterium]
VECLAQLDGRLFRKRTRSGIARPRPGAYLISRRGDEILFVLTNEYNLPGGGIEAGETPVEALRREVMEETGCRLSSSPIHLCDASCYNMEKPGESWHKLNRFFVADVETIAQPIERDHEPVWANPSTIWDRLGPEIRYALKQAGLRVPEMMRVQ